MGIPILLPHSTDPVSLGLLHRPGFERRSSCPSWRVFRRGLHGVLEISDGLTVKDMAKNIWALYKSYMFLCGFISGSQWSYIWFTEWKLISLNIVDGPYQYTQDWPTPTSPQIFSRVEPHKEEWSPGMLEDLATLDWNLLVTQHGHGKSPCSNIP